MKIRLNTVIYVLWADSPEVLGKSATTGEISFGGDLVQIFFQDGAVESMPEEDFRLSGARQLTETAPGSISGLYQMIGPIKSVTSVHDGLVTFGDGSTISEQALEKDYERMGLLPDDEMLANRAIDVALALESLFISVKMIHGIDLSNVLPDARVS